MDLNQYLLIGGSTKCGTTSVFNYFEFHPQVCPCKMKESRFFWTNDYNLTATSRPEYNAKSFDALFVNCEKNKIRLEATPDYLYSAGSAKKIHEALPASRFVFIIREPVSRLVSWYRFSKVNGLIPQHTSLEQYVKLQLEQQDSGPQHLRSLEQGNYSRYIQQYVQLFGKQNVHICFYEKLVSEPEIFCKQIARFSGIDESYFDNFEFKIFNRTVDAVNVEAHRNFRKFKRMVRPATKLFNNTIRKKIKLVAHRLENTYQVANRDHSDNKVIISPELRKYLESFYSDDRQKLNELVQNNYW